MDDCTYAGDRATQGQLPRGSGDLNGLYNVNYRPRLMNGTSLKSFANTLSSIKT